MKELEKAIVSMVRSENVDIKQKMDPARLPIHHCQLVIVNTHPPTVQGPAAIRDSPLTQASWLAGWLDCVFVCLLVHPSVLCPSINLFVHLSIHLSFVHPPLC